MKAAFYSAVWPTHRECKAFVKTLNSLFLSLSLTLLFSRSLSEITIVIMIIRITHSDNIAGR